MKLKCTCGNEKEVCIDCMKAFIEEIENEVLPQTKKLFDIICNSKPERKIDGAIQSTAFELSHHPIILNWERSSE